MEIDCSSLLCTSFLVWIIWGTLRLVHNIYLHPLRDVPGPFAARATTWWKTYVEVAKQESMTDVLVSLHRQYGDVVRVGPNELHFANPAVYHQIYSPAARWDKERTLYESFGEDHSSFGLRKYIESKQRKDVLQPLFSRRAIIKMQDLVRQKANRLAAVLASNNSDSKSSDLLFGFRCFAMDTITTFCFAKSVNALDEPSFAAPIVEAMNHSLPTFHLFKHFPLFRKFMFALPPTLAMKASPETAGLTHLQIILGRQVRDVMAKPEKLRKAPHPTIYHRLLDPTAYKGSPVPDEVSLYEEAQTMLFAGGITVGDTLMMGHFWLLSATHLHRRLEAEVLAAWPDIGSPPRLEVLESLPLLTATIKESLRMAPGACSPLLRVIPRSGATISGVTVPPGTVVGMSSMFVHRSASIFADPEAFNPDRWLDEDAKGLEQWLVPFSRGPRSCLGLNLAWCELYIVFATMLRRFDMKIDGTKAEDLKFRDCFTPFFSGRHLKVWCHPRED